MAAAVAAQELAREDLTGLLRLLSEAPPLSVQMVVPFLPWSEAMGESWLRAPCSRSIAALGALIWLRRVPLMTAGATLADGAAFEDVLVRIAGAFRERSRHEEVALWWQIVGIAYRLSYSIQPGVPPRMQALYVHAAAALARLGGDDATPSPELVHSCAVGNPELIALLVHVALHVHVDRRGMLLQEFFADVERPRSAGRHASGAPGRERRRSAHQHPGRPRGAL